MKLFEAANHYVETSDWKIIAVLKFCLISLGVMVGMMIRPEHKRPVFFGALGVFAILAACLAPLLRLGAQFLLYRLAAFAADLAGTRELSRYLERLGDAFALVLAATASCALLLLVALLVAASMALG